MSIRCKTGQQLNFLSLRRVVCETEFFICIALPKQFTFRKSERLKSRKALDALFQSGRRFTQQPFRVFYAIKNTPGLQFGVSVSNKNFKKAVDRNKIKRLVREAYRLQKNELQEVLEQQKKGMHLFLVYIQQDIADYPVFYKSVEKILITLIKNLREDHT